MTSRASRPWKVQGSEDRHSVTISYTVSPNTSALESHKSDVDIGYSYLSTCGCTELSFTDYSCWEGGQASWECCTNTQHWQWWQSLQRSPGCTNRGQIEMCLAWASSISDTLNGEGTHTLSCLVKFLRSVMPALSLQEKCLAIFCLNIIRKFCFKVFLFTVNVSLTLIKSSHILVSLILLIFDRKQLQDTSSSLLMLIITVRTINSLQYTLMYYNI